MNRRQYCAISTWPPSYWCLPCHRAQRARCHCCTNCCWPHWSCYLALPWVLSTSASSKNYELVVLQSILYTQNVSRGDTNITWCNLMKSFWKIHVYVNFRASSMMTVRCGVLSAVHVVPMELRPVRWPLIQWSNCSVASLSRPALMRVWSLLACFDW